ncbi:hypothetical protein GQ43DRAFT_184484 [Delitschia confertaspora ATCC 74209]|uniref:Secreted protein n=1 Tax=Delitschia confertaspora ATCC 74209 TaxID=1513339 RepID=A0A9P4JH69_9PLEO|nr:hypothetical protein GQ43DRAFT_184484 [Delitschia confertaspora ATCC 74209]
MPSGCLGSGFGSVRFCPFMTFVSLLTLARGPADTPSSTSGSAPASISSIDRFQKEPSFSGRTIASSSQSCRSTCSYGTSTVQFGSLVDCQSPPIWELNAVKLLPSPLGKESPFPSP